MYLCLHGLTINPCTILIHLYVCTHPLVTFIRIQCPPARAITSPRSPQHPWTCPAMWEIAVTVDSPVEECTFITNNFSFSQQNHTPINPLVLAGLPCNSPKPRTCTILPQGTCTSNQNRFQNSINSLWSARKNLQGAPLHLEVVDICLKEVVALNKVYGPYPKAYAPQCRLADLALFLKVINLISDT